MRVLILAVGRMKQGPERELVARYLDRAVAAGKPLGLTGFSVTELTESRAGSAAARKTEEAKALTAQLPAGGIVVCAVMLYHAQPHALKVAGLLLAGVAVLYVVMRPKHVLAEPEGEAGDKGL